MTGMLNAEWFFPLRRTLKHHGICPVCGKPLTIGRAYRVDELADEDRPEGFRPKDAREIFFTLLPLSEIIKGVMGVKSDHFKEGVDRIFIIS